MFTIQRCLVLPAALFAMIAMSSVSVAQCASCDYQQSGGAGYGWPGDGCQSGNCGGGCGSGVGASLEDKWQRFKAECELVMARNEAWPQPFSCQDREIYYQIFNQQMAHGLQVAHTLTSDYFDAETNELNNAGQTRVAWIMQNAPANHKQIYIYEDQTGPTMQQRMQNVRDLVDRWYGHMGSAQIAATQLRPNQIPASYQETYLEAYNTNQQAPVIPVQVGQGISGAVTGN